MRCDMAPHTNTQILRLVEVLDLSSRMMLCAGRSCKHYQTQRCCRQGMPSPGSRQDRGWNCLGQPHPLVTSLGLWMAAHAHDAVCWAVVAAAGAARHHSAEILADYAAHESSPVEAALLFARSLAVLLIVMAPFSPTLGGEAIQVSYIVGLEDRPCCWAQAVRPCWHAGEIDLERFAKSNRQSAQVRNAPTIQRHHRSPFYAKHTGK